MGNNTGRLALPRGYFSRSSSARIRVRVNDGFDQVSAISGRFWILKRPSAKKHTGKPKHNSGR